MHVAPVRLEGNKPAAIDKSLGRVDRAFPIPDGVGAVDMDIARADGGLAPGMSHALAPAGINPVKVA